MASSSDAWSQPSEAQAWQPGTLTAQVLRETNALKAKIANTPVPLGLLPLLSQLQNENVVADGITFPETGPNVGSLVLSQDVNSDKAVTSPTKLGGSADLRDPDEIAEDEGRPNSSKRERLGHDYNLGYDECCHCTMSWAEMEDFGNVTCEMVHWRGRPGLTVSLEGKPRRERELILLGLSLEAERQKADTLRIEDENCGLNRLARRIWWPKDMPPPMLHTDEDGKTTVVHPEKDAEIAMLRARLAAMGDALKVDPDAAPPTISPAEAVRQTIDLLTASRIRGRPLADLGQAVDKAKGDQAIGNVVGRRSPISLQEPGVPPRYGIAGPSYLK